MNNTNPSGDAQGTGGAGESASDLLMSHDAEPGSQQSGAGQGGEPSAGGGEGGEGSSGPDSSSQTTTPAAVALDPTSLKQLIEAVRPPQQPQQPPQPQYTQEQIDELLAIHKIDERELAEALGLDEERQPKAVAFFKKTLDGIVRQAVTAAGLQLKLLEQKHIAPMQQFRQQYEAQQHEARFFDSNPDLKEHRDVCRLIYNDMERRGVKFGSADEAYKAIAKTARQMLRLQEQAGGNGEVPNAGNGGSPSGSSLPKLPTVATGGRGAGGGGSKLPASVQAARELFG